MPSAAERFTARSRAGAVRLGLLLTGVILLLASAPRSAQAHGAIDPVASSFLARIHTVPPGITATVVDGDLRLWLKVPAHRTVVVLDYQGAPYLRFRDDRIWANQNSEMSYFNQTPPANPPPGLKRNAPLRWIQVGSGDSYEWLDGRLQAFAIVATAPGSSYVGPWRIPILVDGHPAAITGALWYRGGPSLVWLWPIAVLFLCVIAAWRLRDPRIDALVARALAGLTLFGITLAAIGRDLHGRPGISIAEVVELAVILALAGWTAWRVFHGRAGSFTYFLVIVAAVWQALSLVPALFNGYVLLAVPPFLGRLATILCLGGAIALVLPTLRLLRAEQADEPSELPAGDGASVTA